MSEGFWDRAIAKAESNAVGCKRCDGTGWVCEKHSEPMVTCIQAILAKQAAIAELECLVQIL